MEKKTPKYTEELMNAPGGSLLAGTLTTGDGKGTELSNPGKFEKEVPRQS